MGRHAGGVRRQRLATPSAQNGWTSRASRQRLWLNINVELDQGFSAQGKSGSGITAKVLHGQKQV